MSVPDFVIRDKARWVKDRAELVKQLDAAAKADDRERAAVLRLQLSACAERIRRLTEYIELRQQRIEKGLSP